MTIIERARETVAAMSDREGWGADVDAIRSGERDSDHRVRVAAQAIHDYLRLTGTTYAG